MFLPKLGKDSNFALRDKIQVLVAVNFTNDQRSFWD